MFLCEHTKIKVIGMADFKEKKSLADAVLKAFEAFMADIAPRMSKDDTREVGRPAERAV